MKLTKNEKQVLRLLLDDGRISDVDMATRMKISTQAVGQIRKKLEEKEFIEGYSCNLNFEKFGLNHFVLVLTKISNQFWKDYGETKSLEIIRQNQQTLLSFLPSGTDISLISLHTFRDIKEMDRYFHLLKAKHNEYFEIIKSYPFSSLNFLKNNPKELLKLVLRDEPIVP